MSALFDRQLLLRQTQTQTEREKKSVCLSLREERGGGTVREPEGDFGERGRG